MKFLNGRSKSYAPALVAVLVSGVLGLVSVAANASPVTLQNGYVKVGVNGGGTLGSGGNTSPGILYDPTGSGDYGINDFLTPGSPFEGFYVTGAGLSVHSNNDPFYGSSSYGSTSLTASSPLQATWTGISADGRLKITNDYTLTTIDHQSVIAITTTLTNNSDALLGGLEFLRTLDPDPDVNAYGSYYTENKVLSDNQACGTGPKTGQTICLYSYSSFAHKAGVSDSWSGDPSDYLNGTNDGDGDYTLGIGFDLGDLGAGQSFTFNYGYALGASIIIASNNPTAVPEPNGLAMLGLGVLAIVGFGTLRRKQRNRG